MISSPKQNPRTPIGDDWLEELKKLFADEFPESECEAQRAVEGVGSDRVPDSRFRENEQ
ncbi:hypothetical protein G6M02_07975 [Agrobacterium rhizogenes]|nr:hypothetical protein [Rhizobium rhizogenes]